MTIERGPDAPSDRVELSLWWTQPVEMRIGAPAIELPPPGEERVVEFEFETPSGRALMAAVAASQSPWLGPPRGVGELVATAKIRRAETREDGWLVGWETISNSASTRLSVVDQEADPSAIGPAGLRFDGFYCQKVGSRGWESVRFFADGRVVRLRSGGCPWDSPEGHFESFELETDDHFARSGSFRLVDGTISVEWQGGDSRDRSYVATVLEEGWRLDLRPVGYKWDDKIHDFVRASW